MAAGTGDGHFDVASPVRRRADARITQRRGGDCISALHTWSESGILGQWASKDTFSPPFEIRLTAVLIRVKTTPVTSSIIVDINKNGVTVFTDQSHRPFIPAGANVAMVTFIDDPLVALGDYLTFEIDGVGASSQPGSDLEVTLVYDICPHAGTAPPAAPTESYSAAVLADNPLLWLRLDDLSGTTAVDSSGNGHDGTYHGSPSLGVTGALAGDPNTAVTFDGIDDYISCPIDLSAYDQLTVEAWLKVASFADNDHLLCEYTPNFNADNVGGFLANPDSSSDSKFDLAMHSNSSNYVVRDFDRPAPGAFAHLILRYDRAALPNATADAVVDGVPVSMGGIATTPLGDNFGNSTLYIMSRAGSSLFLAATLDEFALYEGLLSDARALAHNNAGRGL